MEHALVQYSYNYHFLYHPPYATHIHHLAPFAPNPLSNSNWLHDIVQRRVVDFNDRWDILHMIMGIIFYGWYCDKDRKDVCQCHDHNNIRFCMDLP